MIRHSVDGNQAFSWSICLFDDIFIKRSTFNMHNIFLEIKHLYLSFFNYSPVIRELLNKEKGWKRDTNDYDTLDVRMNRSKVCKDIYIYRYTFIKIISLHWSISMTEILDIWSFQPVYFIIFVAIMGKLRMKHSKLCIIYWIYKIFGWIQCYRDW